MAEADLKAAFDGENSTHGGALRWSGRICADLDNGGSVGVSLLMLVPMGGLGVMCTCLCPGSHFEWAWKGGGVANAGATPDRENWVDFGDGICIELFREVSSLVFDKFSINSSKERSSHLMEICC
jgi:hypothetical protein